MKNIFRSIIIMFGISLLFSSAVFAASSDYRFMHNDHDTLILGEITEINSKKIVIHAADYIVSKNYMDIYGKRKGQIRPEIATVVGIKESGYLKSMKVGDYVLASLNKKGNSYRNAWGILKVDSLNYTTLKVDVHNEEMSAVYTDFVNSGGVYSNYSFHETKVTRTDENGNEVVVYKRGETSSLQTKVPIAEQTQTESQESDKNANNVIYIVCGIGVVLVLLGLIIFLVKRNNK